jgi:hypothetical protein
LIKLREEDIPKEDRAELYKTCEEIYKKTMKSAKKDNTFNVFKRVDQSLGSESKSEFPSESISSYEESEIKEKIPIRHSAVKSIASMNLFNRVLSNKALKDILMQKRMNSLLLSQLLKI